MAKGKFDPTKHGHSEAYRNMAEIAEEDRKKQSGYGHARSGGYEYGDQKEKGKGRGAIYVIEVFKPQWHPVGEGKAQGSKALAAEKKRLTSGMTRGSYRVKVYNRTTGKEVGGTRKK